MHTATRQIQAQSTTQVATRIFIAFLNLIDTSDSINPLAFM
jgi:hypothetical protein